MLLGFAPLLLSKSGLYSKDGVFATLHFIIRSSFVITQPPARNTKKWRQRGIVKGALPLDCNPQRRRVRREDGKFQTGAQTTR